MPTTPNDTYVLKLSQAIVIDGCTTQMVGPFLSIPDADRWIVENVNALGHVKRITCDWLAPPMPINSLAH